MGLRLRLKELFFVDKQPEFGQPVDRRIFYALDRPKTCSEIKDELRLSRSHTHKRLTIMQADRLVVRNSNTFSQDRDRFGLKLKPKVWFNLLGGGAMVVSLPLQNPVLTAVSWLLLGLNAVAL